MLSAVQQTLEPLRTAQTRWSRAGVRERLQAVRRLRGLVSESADEIARVISEEGGKTPLEALTQEVMPFLDSCVFLEHSAEDILADRFHAFRSRLFFAAKKRVRTVHAPYGVIGILGTWNYAFFLNLSQAVFALTAGNAVFVKFSELSPRVADLCASLFARAGFEPDLVRVTHGGAEEGRALIGAGCDKYILTGSRAAGRAVLGRLAEDLKPAIVELSGSDAYLIFSDADWSLAVRSLVWAAFQYSGQTCVAPRRVIVLERDRERFLTHFNQAVAGCGAFVRSQGGLRTEAFAEAERRKLEALHAAGAERIWKSDRLEDARTVAPQLWTAVPEAVADEDWMSPVLFLITVPDEAAALKAAQATPFGLGASVWTRSHERAEHFGRSLRAGQIWINDTLFTVALGEAPFGGFGQSGFGKTRGAEGLLEMTEARLVSTDFGRFRVQVHLPPYRPDSYPILQAIQKIWYGVGLSSKLRAVADMVRACVKK